MLHIIWYIIVGFIVGLIARGVMPGVQHLGFIMTTLLGIAGSIVGGLIVSQALTLFTTPVVYVYLDRLRMALRGGEDTALAKNSRVPPAPSPAH